jgi:hypothetical protein
MSNQYPKARACLTGGHRLQYMGDCRHVEMLERLGRIIEMGQRVANGSTAHA